MKETSTHPSPVAQTHQRMPSPSGNQSTADIILQHVTKQLWDQHLFPWRCHFITILQAERRSTSGRNEYARLCQRITNSGGHEQKSIIEVKHWWETGRMALGGSRGESLVPNWGTHHLAHLSQDTVAETGLRLLPSLVQWFTGRPRPKSKPMPSWQGFTPRRGKALGAIPLFPPWVPGKQTRFLLQPLLWPA